MAIVVDATVGGTSANSYIDVATADAIIETRPASAATWAALTDEQKGAALISATSLLDALRWKGIRSAETQALRWPREAVYDLDGYEYADDAIPRLIQEVTADYAVVNYQANQFGDTGLEGFSKVKVDVIELEIDPKDRANAYPDRIMDRIKFLLASNSLSVPVMRV